MTTLFRLRLAALLGVLLLLLFPSFAVPSPASVSAPAPVAAPAALDGPDGMIVPALLEVDTPPELPLMLTVDLGAPVVEELVPAADRIESQC
jgi:hypothetical protein